MLQLTPSTPTASVFPPGRPWFGIACCLLAWLLAAPTAATAQEQEQTPNANRVQVITYNIRYLNRNDGPDHWDQRAATVAEMIAQGDIVGLQEATRKQIDDVLPKLTAFDWYGVGRDDAKDRGEFSPVFWRTDRFEAVDRGTFWLGPDTAAVGKPAWGANLPRICSWVVLRPVGSAASGSANSTGELLVMNTHFDHQSAEARVNSAKLLREQAEKMAGDRDVIIMGDLNARPDSQPLAALTAQDGDFVLADTITRSETPAQGPTGTWNGFKQIDPDTRIDYILTRADRPRVLAHRTADPKTPDGRFASDHLPVVVALQP